MKKPFTKEEQDILDLIVKAHNKFCELKTGHSEESIEWKEGIHKLENVLIGRVVSRDYPDVFR